jgi:hypothetical protein
MTRYQGPEHRPAGRSNRPGRRETSSCCRHSTAVRCCEPMRNLSTRHGHAIDTNRLRSRLGRVCIPVLPGCAGRKVASGLQLAAWSEQPPTGEARRRITPSDRRSGCLGRTPRLHTEGVARASPRMRGSRSHGRATSRHLRPPRRPPSRHSGPVPRGRPFAAQTLCPTGGGGPRRRLLPGCGLQVAPTLHLCPAVGSVRTRCSGMTLVLPVSPAPSPS